MLENIHELYNKFVK